jgi:alpha-tubulin suppressor-like RCC1 family protein
MTNVLYTESDIDLTESYLSKEYFIDVYDSLPDSLKQPVLFSTASPVGFVYDGTYPGQHSSPTQVISTQTNWRKIEMGSGEGVHLLAIKTDGTLWAWGSNITYSYNAGPSYELRFIPSGQIGNNTGVDQSSPVQIGSETTWRKISAGTGVSAGIKADGTLWTWGSNEYGQLGINAAFGDWRSSPAQVGAGTNWRLVSCGTTANTTPFNEVSWRDKRGSNSHMAAIKADGTLWTWGHNGVGELGLNDANVNRSSPTQVGSATNWKLVSCGGQFTSAIKEDGTLWTWGFNGYNPFGWFNFVEGILGLNDNQNYSSPVQVGSNTNWKSISTGVSHSAAIKTDGSLWVWGINEYGELGLNDKNDRSSPTQLGFSKNWKDVNASNHCGSFAAGMTTALKADGTLWAWGYNRKGALGSSLTEGLPRSYPTQVTGNNWVHISQIFCIKNEVRDSFTNEII